MENPMNTGKLPWLTWEPGDKVVVRYEIEDGVHDALGTLLETNAHFVTIDTRRGKVTVQASQMITGKLVERKVVG